MASPVKLYQKEMHDNMGFYATWLPGEPMQVGDVGAFEKGRFTKLASLAELGIPSEVLAATTSQDVSYTSKQGTRTSLAAGAAVAGAAKAQLSIEFSREGAFLFSAERLRSRRLEGRLAIVEAMVEAYKAGRWKKEWLLVESLYSAERVTIIVSEDRSAEIVLGAETAGPISVASLANPKLGLSVVSTRGRLVHIVGGEGLTPLYSCLRLEDPLFGDPAVRAVRGAGGARDAISKPAIDELLES